MASQVLAFPYQSKHGISWYCAKVFASSREVRFEWQQSMPLHVAYENMHRYAKLAGLENYKLYFIGANETVLKKIYIRQKKDSNS